MEAHGLQRSFIRSEAEVDAASFLVAVASSDQLSKHAMFFGVAGGDCVHMAA